ncbi:hypothetical protein ACFXKF_32885 [Streptomyces scopuliridis]|uniref:hypothetical protein n=1 Tax=Streptomyces scopuliridis TaxID=452529 RepID=UPI0036A2651E
MLGPIWRLGRSDGSRLAVGRIRHHDDGQARTVGATFSVARRTIGLMRIHRHDHGMTRHWYRDFAGRPRRYSIGGGATAPPCARSAHSVYGGGGPRIRPE